MKANGTCQAISLIFLIALGLGLAVRAECIEAQPRPDAMRIQNAPARPAGMAEVIRTDIALDNVWLEPDCQLWVGWKNTGNQKIDTFLRERVMVSGTPVTGGEMYQVVLEPGAYFSHGFVANSGAKLQGTKTVTAVIDFDNVLKESNERNNTLIKTLTCGQ